MATKELPIPSRQWIDASEAEEGAIKIGNYQDLLHPDAASEQILIISKYIDAWMKKNSGLIEKFAFIRKTPINVFLFVMIRKSKGSDFEFTKNLCKLSSAIATDKGMSDLKFSTFDFPACNEEEATEFLSYLVENDGL